jgi:hypothetical protein
MHKLKGVLQKKGTSNILGTAPVINRHAPHAADNRLSYASRRTSLTMIETCRRVASVQTEGLFVNRGWVQLHVLTLLIMVGLTGFSGCSFAFPGAETRMIRVPLSEYTFHRTLGMTRLQLEQELRTSDGRWRIWQDYAVGHRYVGFHPCTFQFIMKDGRVYAIRQLVQTGQISLTWDGTMTWPWIDRRGNYHPELSSPNKSTVPPLVSFRVNGPEMALTTIKQEWHQRHPGVRLTIRYPTGGAGPPEIVTSSGDLSLDAEALDLARKHLPQMPYVYDSPIPHVIELD